VVVDPADYDVVLENLRDNNGETTLKLRERLAIKAFIKSSDMTAPSEFLIRNKPPNASFSLSLPLAMRLRLRGKPASNRRALRRLRSTFEKLTARTFV